MPAIAEVNVVEGNDAVFIGWCLRRIQSEVGPAASVCHLSLANDAQDGSHIARFRGSTGETVTRGTAQRAYTVQLGGAGSELVGRPEVDSATVVGALVLVVVALIGAAELEQVVAVQLGEVIAEHIVDAVPVARAHTLRVHVVWDQGIARFAQWLQCRP